MLDPNAVARELVILIQDLVDDCDGWELTTGDNVVRADDVEPNEQHFTISTADRTFIVRVEELEEVPVKGYNA
jgi:hypothetical protein